MSPLFADHYFKNSILDIYIFFKLGFSAKPSASPSQTPQLTNPTIIYIAAVSNIQHLKT